MEEDYVSLETARLLKEKGFDWETHRSWLASGGYAPCDITEVPVNEKNIRIPTLQMAVKWLRKVHNLFIEPYYTVFGFRASVTDTKTENTVYTQADEDGYYASPELSCESIIRYCLENLI